MSPGFADFEEAPTHIGRPVWPWMLATAVLAALVVGLTACVLVLLNRPPRTQTPAAPTAALEPGRSDGEATPRIVEAQPATAPREAFEPAGRSPLAQAGEWLAEPLPAEVFDRPRPRRSAPGPQPQAARAARDAPATAAPAEADVGPPTVISWEDAGQYIGQTCTVRGRIVNTYLDTRNQVCFLNFSKQREGVFYVIIFQEALASWPTSPDKHFLDKTIEVTGKIFQRGDRSQIRVYEGGQIRVVQE